MRRFLLPTLILGCLGGLVAACFGSAIVRSEQFAYRDAGNYYYPLHRRVQAEWDAGRWPLWEPEENSGMPLLGNPTSAVLYPGKVVFALVPYPLAARLYIIGHTLLAFGAMIALLRNWGVSWVGSALGAMAYAFGAPVLFQYCNVINLVGASWLPLGFLAVDRWLRLGRRIALAELAAVLALQDLGGDPETAYLTGLCAGGYAVGLAWRRGRPAGSESEAASRRTRRLRVILGIALILTLWVVATLAVARGAPAFRPHPTAERPRPIFPWTPWVGPAVAVGWGLVALAILGRWRRRSKAGARTTLVPGLSGLLGAAIVAALLSAAQLLPVLEFIGQSVRSSEDAPSNIYWFSCHPGRLVELAWPNVFGTTDRGNRLWVGALPPRAVEKSLWVPSLYLGGLALVLALGGSRSGPRDSSAAWRRWMAAVAGLALLGSLGEFGSPIWLARRIPRLADLIDSPDPTYPASGALYRLLRDGEGSFYWLLATILPGFDQFRYPSKLLTFTALGLSALAARGWDDLASGDARSRRRIAVWATTLLAATLAALIFSVALRDSALAWLEAQDLSSEYGPFEAAEALAGTQAGLVQAGIVFALALGLTLGPIARRPELGIALALLGTSVDLALANARLVVTVPQAVMDAPSEVVAVIERAERDSPSPGPFRVYRVPLWGPSGWTEAGSVDRFADFVTWARETAEPKYGINLGIDYTLTIGVSELYDYRYFFAPFLLGAREKAARALGVGPGTRLMVYPRRGFDLWNSRYFVLPYASRWDHEQRGIASFIERTVRVHPPPDAFDGPDGAKREAAWANAYDFQVRRNLDAYPRAWVVHEARWSDPIRGLDRASRDRLMQEVLYANEMTWTDPDRIAYNPRRTAWLEAPARPDVGAYLSGGPPTPGESARVVHQESDRVEIEAVLERPGIVVLADIDYPGWTLEIDGRPAPAYRANRLMRGAAVASGRHTLVYTFRPASFRIGLIGSGVGLAAIVLLAIWSRHAPRSDPGPKAVSPRG